ncbi:glycosyltransferase family 2 protein [Flavivirga abyssicola]|uniref:glycosyltransferase family 2 protein n=1 Tax=Flavivirga abyssicola TaxID=3063533 RepID=UPI0026DF3A72|nr:glycosyltransferase family 2 protein [Flavivirga sp. MEBiC07777]WVK13676.1 glycosyltransferase family 2 protein [Flavivirga sp. MEBiC07777]
MKLSVVILNYNVRYFLELCLKSVQTATTGIDAEIIVVDNNSEDESCQMVKELFPDINLIENKTNFGFSKGNNIGVSQAKGEYICILNPDTVVAEDTFLKLLKFSEEQEKVGIVGCKLINGVGLFLPESKRNIPYVKAAFKKIFGNPEDYYANHLQENEVGGVDVLVGAFMLLKRDVYNIVGGFDEDYFMYGEDIDLSYRVYKAGYNNYYYGKSSVIHFKGESTLKDKSYARRFYGAMQIFYRKHFKKNVLFDMLVWLGIGLVYVFRRIPIYNQKRVSQYVFISDVVNEKLNNVLSKKTILKKDLDVVEKQAEVIFNGNSYSYKRIIKMIEDNKDKQITFKILPKNSNFALGSDDAISRGEVIILK